MNHSPGQDAKRDEPESRSVEAAPPSGQLAPIAAQKADCSDLPRQDLNASDPNSKRDGMRTAFSLALEQGCLWEVLRSFPELHAEGWDAVAQAIRLRVYIATLADAELSELQLRSKALEPHGWNIHIPFPESYVTLNEKGRNLRPWLSSEGLIYGELYEMRGAFGYLIDRGVLARPAQLSALVKWIERDIFSAQLLRDYELAKTEFKDAIEKAEATLAAEAER